MLANFSIGYLSDLHNVENSTIEIIVREHID